MIDPGKRDPSILHRISFPGSGKRPAWAALSCASILYACCIALFFFPALGDFRGALIGPPEDNMQDLWNAWHSQTAFASNGKSFFFTRGIFFPEGTSLLYHSFSYVNLFPVFLLRNLFGLTLDIHGLTALNNSMLLLSFYFAAMGMFFLALDFTQDTFSAMVAGYIFAFSPFHFAHSLHHVHIATIQFIPFFALCSLRYIQKPSMLSYIGAVAFFTLSALSSWYYLIYNIYFILFYAGYCAIKNGIRALKATSGPMMAVLAGGFILLSPLVVPMMIAGIADRNAYAIGHSHGVYVADLAGFLIFHPYHLLNDLTQRINDRFTGNVWEMSVYLGVVNLALLLWAIKKRKTIRIPTLGFCLSGMAFFMLFAAGHSLHILGQPTPLLLPTAVTESLPFLSHLRTSSRAVVYVYLFLAIAIGAILRKLCFEPEGWFYRWQRRPGHRMAVTAAILALIFADFYSIAWQRTPVACPNAYEIIRGNKSGASAVLDLPVTYRSGNRAMMYQICHERPIVHASISRKPKKSLIDVLEFDDLGAQKRRLLANGVGHIVVHRSLARGKRSLDLRQYARHYRAEYTDETHAVFSVE